MIRIERTLAILIGLTILSGSSPLDAEGEKGSLNLQGQTYVFDISLCNMITDADGMARNLMGTGRTASGEHFSIIGTVFESDQKVEHSLALQDSSTTRVARHYKRDGSWFSELGPAGGPLFRIEGDRIVARGEFTLNRESIGEGTLDTPCPSPY